jgi:hypothetical protein
MVGDSLKRFFDNLCMTPELAKSSFDRPGLGDDPPVID